MNLNIKAQQENTYDAIVVGTGVSGGWAAKELTEHGLKTLVLDRGRDVKHVVDYPTMTKRSMAIATWRTNDRRRKKIPSRAKPDRLDWPGQHALVCK